MKLIEWLATKSKHGAIRWDVFSTFKKWEVNPKNLQKLFASPLAFNDEDLEMRSGRRSKQRIKRSLEKRERISKRHFKISNVIG